MKLMMITNRPEQARAAANAGVVRMFVDLEINGKFERQGHRDTLISRHTFADVTAIRQAAPQAELIVRVNPWYEGSGDEIEQAVERGADILMLPMFRTLQEVQSFCAQVGGRARVIPLIENRDAADIVGAVANLDAVDELYIGLNDLHISMNKAFMFELLADGTVERLSKEIQLSGKPFGFGGIARVGEGLLPAENILGEHVRLGSSAVILSRTFYRPSEEDPQHDAECLFRSELEKIQGVLNDFHRSGSDRLLANRDEVRRLVAMVVNMNVSTA